MNFALYLAAILIYKCITKIIANRLKPCLPTFISPNQSAFVHGRKISDNILLAQEILKNYHRRGGTPRCAIRVDLMKPYDSVNWEFILAILHTLGTPAHLVGWIKACICSPSFSVSINGGLEGYFKGKCGLR